MRRALAPFAVALLLGTAPPSLAQPWAAVNAPGNPPDDEVACQAGTTDICRANIGAVASRFRISKFEVTNEEYVEFLNAVAASDPEGLFNPRMQDPPPNVVLPGEIVRSGAAGSYSYAVVPGYEDRPIRFVNHFQAFRFANWLHNGKPVGPQDATTTEDGVYTLLGANDPNVTRNPGARYWLPNEDEWYKAAYFDPLLGWYTDYPTGSDVPPVGEPPVGGANSANYCPKPWTEGGPATCEPGVSLGPDTTTDVGSYPGSPSPWGTFDQAGNVWELLEDRVIDPRPPCDVVPCAALRGSGYARGPGDAASFARSDVPMTAVGNSRIGFRIARKPANGCGLGAELVGLLPLLVCLRGRGRRPRASRAASRRRF